MSGNSAFDVYRKLIVGAASACVLTAAHHAEAAIRMADGEEPAAASYDAVAVAPLSDDEVRRIVIDAAIENGIPPSLALAVAQVESDFDPNALSNAGARGVMQIMPATAENEFGVDPAALWDPKTNAAIGARYLHRLYVRYGKRWDAALSHYNGGALDGPHAKYAQPHAHTETYVSAVFAAQTDFQRDRRALRLIAEARKEADLDALLAGGSGPFEPRTARRAQRLASGDAVASQSSRSEPAAPFEWRTARRARQLAQAADAAGRRAVRDDFDRDDSYSSPSRWTNQGALALGRAACDCDEPPSAEIGRRFEIVRARFEESMAERRDRMRPLY